jgi:hypothetical protein
MDLRLIVLVKYGSEANYFVAFAKFSPYRDWRELIFFIPIFPHACPQQTKHTLILFLLCRDSYDIFFVQILPQQPFQSPTDISFKNPSA